MAYNAEFSLSGLLSVVLGVLHIPHSYLVLYLLLLSRVSYVDLNNPYWFGYMLLSYAEQEGKDIPEYVKTIDDAELIAENFTEEFLSFLLKTIGEDTDSFSSFRFFISSE